MKILIEGPDGSGKTTLAKMLAKLTGYRYTHFSKPESEDEHDAMLTMYENVLRKKSENIILDRCWYSEIIYGNIMRDQPAIDWTDMYRLEKLARDSGAILIYCTGTIKFLWDNATSRGEDYITDIEKFSQICRYYDKVMFVPHYIPVLRYSLEDFK